MQLFVSWKFFDKPTNIFLVPLGVSKSTKKNTFGLGKTSYILRGRRRLPRFLNLLTLLKHFYDSKVCPYYLLSKTERQSSSLDSSVSVHYYSISPSEKKHGFLCFATHCTLTHTISHIYIKPRPLKTHLTVFRWTF